MIKRICLTTEPPKGMTPQEFQDLTDRQDAELEALMKRGFRIEASVVVSMNVWLILRKAV